MAGIKLRPHDFRGQAANHVERSGLPIEIISKIRLRPADFSTTQPYLGQVFDDAAIGWMENLHWQSYF
jgi:integrase/recombinase XerD